MNLIDYDTEMAMFARGVFNNSSKQEFRDLNVVVLDRHQIHTLKDHVEIIQRYLDHGDLDLIVFFHPGEGIEVGYCNIINSCVEYFSQRNVPQEKFAYLNCIDWCAENLDLYDKFKRDYNLPYLPDVLCYSTNLANLYGNHSELINNNLLAMDHPTKTHNFLCLNHQIRIPRYLFLAEIYNNNLQEQFLASLHLTMEDIDENNHDHIIDWSAELNSKYFAETGFDQISLDRIKKHVPLKLDYHHSRLFELTDLDQNLFNNTRVNIIPEAFFCSSHFDLLHESHRTMVPFQVVSEKILKAIMMGLPFIALGTPGLLRSIRSLGYRTFGSVIDESYDTITHDYDRMQAVISEVKRLSKFTEQDWQEFNNQIRDDVLHNKLLMRSRGRLLPMNWLSEACD